MTIRRPLLRNMLLVLAAVVLVVVAISYMNRSQAAQTVDKVLTKQLTSEKQVMGGKVYFYDKYVIAVMNMKSGTDRKTTINLAKQYVETLDAKYTDKKVNVQAVCDNENVANITK
jgi:hypothetical protein